MADHRSGNGDYEISQCKDIVEGEDEGFSMGVGGGEFTHEEIGVEQKNDECHLDEDTSDAGDGTAVFGGWLHGWMITAAT